MTPQELLLKAADHIEKYGKIAGKWVPDEAVDELNYMAFNRDCAACAGGAVAIEVSDGRDFSPNFVRRPSERKIMEEAFGLLADRLDLMSARTGLATPLDAVIEWSDTHTQAEVVSGLRQAAG